MGTTGIQKHTVLLVEHEQQIANEVKDMLYSLGHECQHAWSQEEAMEYLTGACGEICYVLMELKLPCRRESSARPQTGHNLLKDVRDRFPITNQHGEHYFPVIVMSANVREDKYIYEAYDKGASDFMQRPFSRNRMPFGDQIRGVLVRSGRAQHSDCSRMTDLAAGITLFRPLPPLRRVELSVGGRMVGKRLSLTLNRKEILVPLEAFRIVVRLVFARLSGGDGYVHKTDLGASESWQGMSRTKRELARALDEGEDIIENNRQCQYRLRQEVEVTGVDWNLLATLEDHGIKTLAAKALAMLAARAMNAKKEP